MHEGVEARRHASENAQFPPNNNSVSKVSTEKSNIAGYSRASMQ